MNGISAVQPNNIFRVNPVNLFEKRNQQEKLNSGFFEENSNFNLTHPKVSGNNVQANFLDFLA